MEVLVLGSAGSAPVPGRATSCYMVGDTLLDVGIGCLQNLLRTRGIGSVSRILVTHLHGDHVGDLGSLLWTRWLYGVGNKLTIVGPPGLRMFLGTYVAQTGVEWNKLFRGVSVVEILPGEEWGGVRTAPASHTVTTIAYRLGGVVYTGDTAFSEKIVSLAKGAKVLMHEATYPEGWEDRALSDGHSTPVQAAEAAALAGVETLVLTHLPYFRLGPSVGREYARSAERVFDGRVIVPEELSVLEL